MINRFIYITGAIMLTLFTLGSCSSSKTEEKGVAVTIEPFRYFVDQLMSERVPVSVMVPMGSSPATYAPTTSQLMALSSASVYVQAGHLGFEDAWMHRLKELNPDMDVLNLSKNIQLIKGEDHQHGDHMHEGGIDPHIWMSPKIVMELLPDLKNVLIKNFPQDKKIIDANFLRLLTEVETIHNNFSTLSDQEKSNKFMIFHPALTYLARDYGLEQISIEYEGKEPSPAKLKELIDKALEEKIKIIFIQAEFDQRNAEMVREATGAQLVVINPLGYNWPATMKNIRELLSNHLK
ncbi:metal ABC transporter solute-binding protein, Zn/Mn family [Marinilabilia salmonicolor]|uniref:metal ABC transporter solute-binding protein, Zn/Mn family n=2 Tax=Marinilabilia salmonicolor TaxID=989 RepID=UPI00029A99F6|nr:zinc ABC transporter substrate-binding protein [Marinilabilia salmonicolor]